MNTAEKLNANLPVPISTAPRISYAMEEVPVVTGLPRTKIYEAVREGKLTVRKSGRSSIVEHDELVRFVKALPTKGRTPDAEPTVHATA
jgi:hypothetical protein